MFLKLNWLGIHVADFDAALRFYTGVVGLSAADVKPNWAYFATTGMILELFGGGLSLPDESRWGQGQPVRPGILVADLRKTVAEMRQRGVTFTGDILQTAWGEQVEWLGPENMRWTLVSAPDDPLAAGLDKAHIGWLELKVERLSAQQAFYRDVIGLQLEETRDGQVILKQGPGEPRLLLEVGGQRAVLPRVERGALQPPPAHLLSCETDDIEQASATLKAHGATMLIEQITQKSWGGIDFYIADPDGNPIQIVQYTH